MSHEKMFAGLVALTAIVVFVSFGTAAHAQTGSNALNVNQLIQNYQSNCTGVAAQANPSCAAIQNQAQTAITQFKNNCMTSTGQIAQTPSCVVIQNQVQSVLQNVGASGSGSTNANSGTDSTKVPYTLLSPLPCSTGLGVSCNGVASSSGQPVITSISLSDFVSYAYKLMLALAVFLAVFMITVGGFEYMLSGATGTKTDAIKKIQDALWGLLLALVAYLLLFTIDPNLVSPSNLSIPPISYGSLTQTSGLTTALQMQLQQDQANAVVLNEAASLSAQAQQALTQANQLYGSNGCIAYTAIPAAAPAACIQAQQLMDQANGFKVQALTVQQQGYDNQTISLAKQAILTNPGVQSCGSGNIGTASQCYEGYQLSSAAQAAVQTQLDNIASGQQNFTQQVSGISSSADTQAVVNESASAHQQVQTAIQNAIAQQIAAQNLTPCKPGVGKKSGGC